MAKILVVDDSRLVRVMAGDVLRHTGHEVIEAHDGQEALIVVDREGPDCVVTDLVMPVLGGVEYLARLLGSHGNVPVIVLTADVQSSTRQLCGELGVRAFLTKPLDGKQLQEAVDEALARARGGVA